MAELIKRVFYNDAEHLKAIAADLDKEGWRMLRTLPQSFGPHLALFEPKPDEAPAKAK
jgi:hypothetical protein